MCAIGLLAGRLWRGFLWNVEGVIYVVERWLLVMVESE